jgi:hypothetical protein
LRPLRSHSGFRLHSLTDRVRLVHRRNCVNAANSQLRIASTSV